MKKWKSMVCAVGVVAAGACIPFTSIGLPRPDPNIASPYEAPTVYNQWWAVAESCAHETKNLSRWHWYSVKPPGLEGPGGNPGLSTERNELYVREGHTLDRIEVMSQMVRLLTPMVRGFSGDLDLGFFKRTLACSGIDNTAWRDPWRPDP